MNCIGFLTPEKLGREANHYGDVGGRPQVVWANGVLASTAVGLAIDLLTNWTKSKQGQIWLVYIGNDGTIMPENVQLASSPESLRTLPFNRGRTTKVQGSMTLAARRDDVIDGSPVRLHIYSCVLTLSVAAGEKSIWSATSRRFVQLSAWCVQKNSSVARISAGNLLKNRSHLAWPAAAAR